MSSVQKEDKCPQCGGCYFEEFNCRTFEEFKFCPRCGKKELVELVRDENDNAVYDADNKPQYKESSQFGYGCLCLVGKKGGSTLYSLTQPLTDEELANIQKSFNADVVDVGKSYLTKWDDKKKDAVAVFGELPRTYDEMLAEEADGADDVDESPEEESSNPF